MTEAVNLQVNDDMAFQDAVIKDEVCLEVVLIHQDAALPGFKAEPLAHLEQEVLQVVQYLVLQFALSENVLMLQSEEFQCQRVVDGMLGLQCIGPRFNIMPQRQFVL